MQSHLRNKKLLEKEKQNELIIPEKLFKEEQTPFKKQIKEVKNIKTLKHIAGGNIKLDDNEFDKELAKKMINSFYFTDKSSKKDFKIILDSLNFNHADSLLTIEPNFTDFRIETRHINKILKELANIYSRLINQHKFKYHTLFSASFHKINEEDQRNCQIELFLI